MKISIQSLLEGAARGNGTVGIIDVFRAFTTAAVALANGASRIIMVVTVDEALALALRWRRTGLHGWGIGPGATWVRLREFAVRGLQGRFSG